MKLIHLSDLHIGKHVNGFSLIEDQEYILSQIIETIRQEKADVVLLAGDIYDSTMPSAESVRLFDRFVTAISEMEIKLIVISGNHDSADRNSFGSKIMSKSGIYFSKAFAGELESITLHDELGNVNFYLLPFVKPLSVRRYFDGEKIESYTDAISAILAKAKLNLSERNVILVHQFLTDAAICDSEEISVGGSENVDASIFDDFDYVALGHLHGPQYVEREAVRYCGSPLKYSFSESSHKKSLTVIEMKEKSDLQISTIALKPLRDMRQIKGSFEDVMRRVGDLENSAEDYVRIILTDEDDVLDAASKLRTIYPNLMRVEYDNVRSRTENVVRISQEKKSTLEYLEDLFVMQNGQPMSEAQRSFADNIIKSLEG